MSPCLILNSRVDGSTTPPTFHPLLQIHPSSIDLYSLHGCDLKPVDFFPPNLLLGNLIQWLDIYRIAHVIPFACAQLIVFIISKEQDISPPIRIILTTFVVCVEVRHVVHYSCSVSLPNTETRESNGNGSAFYLVIFKEPTESWDFDWRRLYMCPFTVAEAAPDAQSATPGIRSDCT